MASIYLVRHGQASFGGSNYDQLSALGHRQAQVLGSALAARGLRPSRLVAGAMRRHAETAQGCIAGMGAEQSFDVDAGWNEYDHLDILARLDPRFAEQPAIAAYVRARSPDAKPFAQLFREAMTRWMSGAHDTDYRETWPQFSARVETALARLSASLPQGEQAVVFTSGGVISVVARQLLGLDLPAMMRVNAGIANASVTKLLLVGEGAKLSTLNEHGHFEHAADELLSYR
jgi:broad specificity phosphatase PhoE